MSLISGQTVKYIDKKRKILKTELIPDPVNSIEKGQIFGNISPFFVIFSHNIFLYFYNIFYSKFSFSGPSLQRLYGDYFHYDSPNIISCDLCLAHFLFSRAIAFIWLFVLQYFPVFTLSLVFFVTY